MSSQKDRLHIAKVEANKEIYQALAFFIFKSTEKSIEGTIQLLKYKKKYRENAADFFIGLYSYQIARFVVLHSKKLDIDTDLFNSALAYRMSKERNPEFIKVWNSLSQEHDEGRNYLQVFCIRFCKQVKVDELEQGTLLAEWISQFSKTFYETLSRVFQSYLKG